MSPYAKSGLTWLAVFAAVGMFFAIRFAWVQGVFSSVAPIAPPLCRAVAEGIKDPADIAADTAHNALFVAATNRQAAKPYSDAQDGLYFLKLNDPTAVPVKLTGTPKDFHPVAISLYRGEDGAQTLLVVDRHGNDRHSVESYGVTIDGQTPKLAPLTTIQSGLLVSPSGIVAAAPDHFYVSNDRVSRNGIVRFAEDYLLWPHADLLAYSGQSFRIAAQRLAAPAGLLIKDTILYVALANSRKVQAFEQDMMGYLTPLGELSLPARPSSLSLDDHGNLIVAGQTKPGSSQVFRVLLNAQGAPQSYQAIFSDDGKVLSGASAAVIAGGQLFIAASNDNKILACPMK
jgi:hypothetical protein